MIRLSDTQAANVIIGWFIEGLIGAYLIIWAECKFNKISASRTFVIAASPVIPMNIIWECAKYKLYEMWSPQMPWVKRYILCSLLCYMWAALLVAIVLLIALEYEKIIKEGKIRYGHVI